MTAPCPPDRRKVERLLVAALAVTIMAVAWQLYPMAEEPVWPEYATANPFLLKTYGMALAHYDHLRYIPCYCGCDRLGHTSNADCYLESPPGVGGPRWVAHAAT